eukprot:CCRYP_014574-RA/>CCRYP_014574-RA protein AED:0.38 eAED:0.38 QI:0/-1/0/1/-1/1/1/0/268
MATIPTEEIAPSIESTQSSAVNWDDLIDPFRQIAIAERINGQTAGRRAGYLEGENIGRSKAWEIGLELGYIHSFARHLLDMHQKRLVENEMKQPARGIESSKTIRNTEQDDRFSKRLNRCLTICQELITRTNQFPDPDSLLDRYENTADNIESNKKKYDDSSTEDFSGHSYEGKIGLGDHKSTSEAGVNAGDAEDVTSALQRIRAKFKLLLVLLSTNRSFDLKRLLNTKERCNQPQPGNRAISEGSEKMNKSPASVEYQSDLERNSNW